MKVFILGAGLVGGPMAIDLVKGGQFEVTVVDRDAAVLEDLKSLQNDLEIIRMNLSKPENVIKLLEHADLAINAMPGFLGFRTAGAILEAGRNSVDISFYEEDPFRLDDLARRKNVTMIMDCGVCPGLNNMMIMHYVRQMERVDSVITYVGGLPCVREWPSEYKAVFSPIDVIEEYIRPARYVENGIPVVKPALSDPELIHFPDVGTLEAFNTDGLRTLAKTLDVPNMKEKTLRYPGHIEKMKVLRELGFFSKEKTIRFNDTGISPLEFTAQVMFPHWKLQEGEEDFTVMQIIIEGVQAGKRVRHRLDLLDRFDPETHTISMARTTGYTATVALRMIAGGLYSDKGISPAEYIGNYPECVAYMKNGLADRNIHIRSTTTEG